MAIPRQNRTVFPTLGIGLMLLIPLFYFPMGSVLLQAFRTPEGYWSIEQAMTHLTRSYTWNIAWFTIRQAFYSTLGSLLIGLPGAYLISHYRFRGKTLMRSVSTIPFVLPPIIIVLGFVIFYGNQGILNRTLMGVFSLDRPPLRIMYSLFAIILAHSFYNFPIIIRSVGTYWEGLSDHYERAAYSLGAGKFRTFFTVTLPRLVPAIISSSSLIFLFCFTSFAIILVLGGGPQYTTLEVEIYRQARVSFDTSAASLFALLSLSFTLLILFLYNKLQSFSPKEEISTSRESPPRRVSSPLGKIASALYVVLFLIFLFSPLLSVVLRSFQAQTHRAGDIIWTLRWYEQLFSPPSGAAVGNPAAAIGQSLLIALLTVAAVTPLAMMFSYGTARLTRRISSVFEVFMLLPMMISSVLLGLGYYLIARTVRGSVDISPHVLIVFAHMVITLPFIYRITVPSARQAYTSFSPAASSLGAAPWRSFRDVELPVIKGSLFTGMVFVFALSMGEFNATLVLSDAQIQTIPILMYRLIGAYNFFAACALGTVLMICSAAAFYLFDRADTGGIL